MGSRKKRIREASSTQTEKEDSTNISYRERQSRPCAYRRRLFIVHRQSGWWAWRERE